VYIVAKALHPRHFCIYLPPDPRCEFVSFNMPSVRNSNDFGYTTTFNLV